MDCCYFRVPRYFSFSRTFWALSRGSIPDETLYPEIGATSDSVMVDFLDQVSMGHFVKCFYEVQRDDFQLLTVFDSCGQVMYCDNLGLT